MPDLDWMSNDAALSWTGHGPPYEKGFRALGSASMWAQSSSCGYGTPFGSTAHGSTRRFAPALHRFAVQDWTVGELVAALDRQLALRECTLRRRIRQPELCLAWLFGAVEPADPPGEQPGPRRSPLGKPTRPRNSPRTPDPTGRSAAVGLAACCDALNQAARRSGGEH